ncbi:MAG: hypothetical protein SV186_00480 [Candidatus Nanohaloarchaea archaeon]|nr:hypothetical protein [Candidatus Nanohaloarchaea archaeon]
MTKDREDAALDAISKFNHLLIPLAVLAAGIGGFMLFFKLIGFAVLAGGAEAGVGWLPTAFAMGAAEPLLKPGPGPTSFSGLLVYTVLSVLQFVIILGLLYISTRGLQERMAVGWYATIAFYGAALILIDSILIRLGCLLFLYLAWKGRETVSFDSDSGTELRQLRATLRDDIHHFREGNIDKLFPDEERTS